MTELTATFKAVDDETWGAARELVARIDEDLTRGIRHYYTKSGKLLTTLDEVVQAILDNNLLTVEVTDVNQNGNHDHAFNQPADLLPAPLALSALFEPISGSLAQAATDDLFPVPTN